MKTNVLHLILKDNQKLFRRSSKEKATQFSHLPHKEEWIIKQSCTHQDQILVNV